MGNINTIEVFQDLNGKYIEAVVPKGKKVVLTKFGGYRLENNQIQKVHPETKYNYGELNEKIFVFLFFVLILIFIVAIISMCDKFILCNILFICFLIL